MAGCSRGSLPTWMTAAASRVDLTGGAVSPSHQGSSLPSPSSSSSGPAQAAGADQELGMFERALSAAGAAFVSAIIVNPLDVAKTRLQAQAAGVLYHHPPQMATLGPDAILSEFKCSPSCTRGLILGEPVCPPDCFQYKGTLDVFLKVVRQEGFGRLWRGTNAGLALAVPTVGIYLPCYDIFRNRIEDFTRSNAPGLTPYAPLVAGSVARSLACIACSPIELARTRMQAYKEFRPGVKPPGMYKTLTGVRRLQVRVRMYKTTVLCGLGWVRNLLGMFLSLVYAGQLLSLSGENCLVLLEKKAVQLVYWEQTLLLALWQAVLLLVLHALWMLQKQGDR